MTNCIRARNAVSGPQVLDTTKTSLHPLCKQFSRLVWDKALPFHGYRKEKYADMQINVFRVNEGVSAQPTYEVARSRGR